MQPVLFLLRDTLPGHFPVNTGAGSKKSFIGPSYMDCNIQPVNGMLTLALYKLLSGYNIIVSWVCIVNTGFFCRVHLFVDHPPDFKEDLEITRKLRVVFQKPIKPCYHCLGG